VALIPIQYGHCQVSLSRYLAKQSLFNHLYLSITKKITFVWIKPAPYSEVNPSIDQSDEVYRMKRFFVLVVAVVLVLFGLATAPAYAFNQADLTKLQSTNQCKDCDLSEAALTNTNLMGADLERANLAGADLTGANLAGADLEKANLGTANLSEANLSGAELEKANLMGANLTNTNLMGTSLEKATMPDGSKHA